MTEPRLQPAAHTLQFEIEIDAPIEAVWKALTDADELTRWFPLAAKVTPGVGGSFFASWGPGEEGSSKIEIWEPNRHLRAIQQPLEASTPEPASPGQEAAPAPLHIVDEYFLEARGGKTILRLVNHGFGSGADWENEYFEALRHGWPYMLNNLRHYLQFHAGKPRLVAWPRIMIATPQVEAWNLLIGREGLAKEGKLENAQAGDRYSLRAATGDALSGVITHWDPPFGVSMTVEGLNNALLGISVGKCGVTAANIWLSAYGVPPSDVLAFGQRWVDLLNRLFPGEQKAVDSAARFMQPA